ncbi:MAG: DUF5132 domain-containing protein [Acidobacteriota bacterium]
MWQQATAFLLGVVAAPVAGGILRPLTRELIKGVILTSQQVKKVAHEVREDLEDLTAEAAADISEAPAKPKGRRK